jgi:Ca2+-binding RTX toxin-like protein
MSTLRAAALAAVIALAGLPAAADAGTVSYNGSGTSLTFAALPGEANQLAVSRDGDVIVFRELGGLPISAASTACDGTGTPTVSCAVNSGLGEPVSGVTATLGDLDDSASAGALGGTFLFMDGGPGGDQLDAAAVAFGYLAGGEGDDRLAAGREQTELFGDAGDDTLIGGPAGSRTLYDMDGAADGKDVIAGGAGFDVVEYDNRTVALRLTADGIADDGEPGEGDNIAPAVEGIQGGGADDVIAGSNAVDAALSGYGGADRLSGGAGDDVLFGGDGDDTLAGNAGDDTAATTDDAGLSIGGGPVDAGADSFAGGPGFDTTDYSSRLAPVSITLDGLANDGESLEGDNAGADVEGLIGGHGADVLTGTAATQRIVGGSGGDRIDPGAGADEVRAGDGDDVVTAQDGNAEPIACGLGADSVTADFVDMLDACEAVTLSPPPVVPDTRKPKVKLDGLPARPRFHHVRSGLRPRLSADEPVAYVVELLGAATRAHIARRYNLTLARRTISRTSKPRRITLRPKSALLGERRKLRVRIRVTATDAAGNATVLVKTLKVRR